MNLGLGWTLAAGVLCSAAMLTSRAYGAAADDVPIVVSTYAGGAHAGDRDGAAPIAEFRSPTAIALARDGSLYVADPVENVIRVVAPDRSVRTFAGKPGVGGNHDGPLAEATFLHPFGVAVASDGTVYVADRGNVAVRKIARGVVTTIAGGAKGALDGKGATAQFASPRAVAVDAQGDVYVADFGVGVRKVAPNGTVTTLASLGTKAVTDVSCAGKLLWVASDAGLARYETTGANALLGTRGTQTMQAGAFDGFPYGVAALNDSEAAFTDVLTQTVRYVDSTRPARVLAGAAEWDAPQFAGGFADGNGDAARFFAPTGVAWRRDGTLLVADSGNHRIRAVSAWDRRTFIRNDGAHLDEYVPGPNDDGIAWISNSQAWFDTTFTESVEGVAQADLARSPLYARSSRRPKIVPIALDGAEAAAVPSIVSTYFSDGLVKVVVWQVNCTFGIDGRNLASILGKVDALLRPKHVGFVVVLQPTSIQDFPNESLLFADTNGWDPNFDGRPSSCYQDFQQVLKQSGIVYEDAYPAFAAVEDTSGGPLFASSDQHLNARGRALIGHAGARAVLRVLRGPA